MTTFKGAMRSIAATSRRIERDQQRRAREAAKRFKELQKLQDLADAEQAYHDWNDYVNMLTSVHKNSTTPVNWDKLKAEKQPNKPTKSKYAEEVARINLLKFKPSIIDKIFNTASKKTSKLESKIEQAILEDNKIYEKSIQEYENKFSEWSKMQKIAEGVINKEPEFYLEALQYFNPFDDLSELGSQLKFDLEKDYIDIDLSINDKEVIPDYELNLTSTGKLTKKNTPKTRFNDLYQDHICSCVLRVAGEIFSYLPVDLVRINASTKLLNAKTGHMEDSYILSVIISRSTYYNLNLKNIDPSDSMENFIHTMNYKKTIGFGQVEKTTLSL